MSEHNVKIWVTIWREDWPEGEEPVPFLTLLVPNNSEIHRRIYNKSDEYSEGTGFDASDGLWYISLFFKSIAEFAAWADMIWQVKVPLCNVILDATDPYDVEFITYMSRNNIGIYLTDNRPNGHYEVQLFGKYESLRTAIIDWWLDEDLIALIER
jgi:hypothetical protein